MVKLLIRFEFENFKSFKDRNTLSMECVNKCRDLKEINTFKVEKKELLKSALVFGANASGKSNLFKALYVMKNMVLMSVLPMNVISSIEPYKFCTENINKPVTFEVEILIDEVIYIYGFSVQNHEVQKEWLYKNKLRKTLLFERTSSDYKDIKLYGEFQTEEKIKERVSKKSLMLSVSAMLNNSIASKITNWFFNLEFLGILDEKSDLDLNLSYLDENPKFKDRIIEYLINADFGISDLKFDIEEVRNEDTVQEEMLKNEMDFDMNVKVVRKKISLNTVHKIYDDHNKVVGDIELPLIKHESNGTKKLFSMIAVMLKVLDNGGVLIIDEIDAKLHPQLVRMLIKLFNSIDSNISNAQLICSSHDILLLDEELRRDQIWFVNKDEYTKSELYCLCEYVGVRKDSKLLKKYLLGVFDAVPFKRGEI